jgi:hypothetical protein
MRKLTRYWFTPSYQPSADKVVEFEVKPLSQETLYTMQASLNERGIPSWEGVRAAFETGVVGWKNIQLDGADAEFTPARAASVLRRVGSADWTVWLGQIAGELFRNAYLSDEEKKT